MLTLVATPIGNLKDITLRALETLKEADLIACEDKRVSSTLLNHYGISKPLLSYHDHNAEQTRPKIMALLRQGKSVAYITDGGLPLISDPGYKLVVACREENLPYTVIPGPSAPLMALCLSALPPDRFLFCGFLPPKSGGRKAGFEDVKDIAATLIFFESPKRLVAFLADAKEVLGERRASVSREMTKMFEETQQSDLSQLITHFTDTPPRGEIVVVIEGALTKPDVKDVDIETHLQNALERYSMKEAVSLVATACGLSKREVYQRALQLKSKTKGPS